MVVVKEMDVLAVIRLQVKDIVEEILLVKAGLVDQAAVEQEKARAAAEKAALEQQMEAVRKQAEAAQAAEAQHREVAEEAGLALAKQRSVRWRDEP